MFQLFTLNQAENPLSQWGPYHALSWPLQTLQKQKNVSIPWMIKNIHLLLRVPGLLFFVFLIYHLFSMCRDCSLTWLDLSKSKLLCVFFKYSLRFRHVIFFVKFKICETRIWFCQQHVYIYQISDFHKWLYSWLKARPWWWRWQTWRKVHFGILGPFQPTQYALHQHHHQRLGCICPIHFL